MSLDTLNDFLCCLVAQRRAELGDLDAQMIVSLGIEVRSGHAILDPSLELLDSRAIREGLSPESRAWLRTLEIKPATGSTNSDLMQTATAGIDGRVILAETQLGGRGRRGRTWISPFARNIALTMGIEVQRKGHELGSLSLTVGLAVLKALESLGIDELALKWPNDILYRERKLCGVLIEVGHSRNLPQAVVGIGINHGGADLVRARIDQELADLTEVVSPPGRNATVAAVISCVHEHSLRFNRDGFASMADEWQSHHFFQGREVRVSGWAGDLFGKVLGVSKLGELRMQTSHGERLVSGGEISMRALDSPGV